MTDKTLFLAWQDKRLTREWFPVGRLDVPCRQRRVSLPLYQGRGACPEPRGL